MENLTGGSNKMSDFFIQNKMEIDYKNAEVLKKFVSPDGKILPCRRSGLIAKNQRKLTRAIRRARSAGLMPFSGAEM